MQKQKNKKKVLLTGGHAGTSVVAVVNQIKKQKLPWTLHFIGPAKAYQGKDIEPYEVQAMSKLGVKSYSINASKAQRTASFSTLRFILKLPLGFLQALRIVDAIRPNVILSFGGYVAFPVVIIGKLLGSRVIIHEQIVTIGIANKFTKYFANKIALGWKQSAKYFSKKKSVYVGLPIREEILKIRPKDSPSKPITILAMGGSRGSVPINNLLLPTLNRLLNKYKVIHIAGNLDVNRFKKYQTKLSAEQKDKYKLHSFLSVQDLAKAYSRSDIIISRSGAHSVNELLYLKRPAILIPLPLTNNREQDKNAEVARRVGIARVFQQSELTSEGLLAQINLVSKNWRKIRAGMQKGQLVEPNAAEKLVELVKETLP